MSESNLPSGAPRHAALPKSAKKCRSCRRSGSVMTLDNPTPTQALPLLWDETEYTLPVNVQDQPFQVTIEQVWPIHFANLAIDTLVEYLWQGDVEHSHTIHGPYDPEVVFPLTQALPAHLLSTGGIRRFTYRVSSPFIPQTESFPTFINVDKTAPNANNPGLELEFDAEALVEVTEDYLVSKGGVPATVPRWLNMRTEDVVRCYWGVFPDVVLAGTVTIDRSQVEGAPIEFLFDEAFVRSSGQGQRFASYSLTDRAGNVGPFSMPQTLNVSLSVLPDLSRPLLPQVEPDVEIYLKHVQEGLTVSISEISDALPGDQIIPFWNTHALTPITLQAVQHWPITVTVPWPILADGGFDGQYVVRVRYQYRRGTGTKDSPNSFYLADLTVAGPDPIGPDPINPGLARVTVKGKSGDNVVTAVDAPGPVPVEVALFANPVAGQRMKLYWGNDGVDAGEYEVQPGDVAGQIVIILVSWTVISTGSNPALEVYYWTDNEVNRQRSPFTSVRVEFDTLLGLQRPQLLNDSDRDFVSCATSPQPWEGVFMGIDWNPTHFEVGDTVRLYWKSYPNKNGAGEPFDGTDVWFDHPLTSEDRDEGMAKIQILPFNPLITLPGLVAEFGSAVVSYRLYKAAGPTGLSQRKLIYIDLKRPGGGTCLGPVSEL
ncbi:hypothetical protein AO262_28175 [Pseudomonas fluorescens ABAC62]|nr:hypothetical protein AO262_28175 [Pseudomonas fluorescens ABAC62]